MEQLLADGYAVDIARNLPHARTLARVLLPEVAIIGELELTRGAVELLEEIRRAGPRSEWNPSLPAIVLGRSREPLDLLRAFDAGADDYVPRSAPYLELRARLRALLRRPSRASDGAGVLRVGPLRIDAASRSVALHGRPIQLRRLEFALLLELASDPSRVFTRDELAKAIWGERTSGSTRRLDSHASRLRMALSDPRTPWISSVRGVGYRLR